MFDSMIGCPSEGNRVAPGRMLCKDCERDYLRRLKALNGLMQALDSVAMREARVGSQQGRRPTTGFAPSPIDWTADALRDDAARWMRLVLSRIYVGHGLIPLSQWRRMWVGLVVRRNTILTLDSAPCDYMALVHVTDRIDRRLTPQPDRILWGHCPECDAKIYAPPAGPIRRLPRMRRHAPTGGRACRLPRQGGGNRTRLRRQVRHAHHPHPVRCRRMAYGDCGQALHGHAGQEVASAQKTPLMQAAR